MQNSVFDKLINRFTKIPTVGLKTAERYAYSIINMSEEDVDNFAKNLLYVKKIFTTAKLVATGQWKTTVKFVGLENQI